MLALLENLKIGKNLEVVIMKNINLIINVENYLNITFLTNELKIQDNMKPFLKLK